MSEPGAEERRRIYAGQVLAETRHLVRLLTKITPCDEKQDADNTFYHWAVNPAGDVQKIVSRAEALADATINKEGGVAPPIPPVT